MVCNKFKPYFNSDNEIIPHRCFIKGDSKFVSIAAASILAKVYHDNYIDQLIQNEPELEKYHWHSNMCYGTAKHIDAINSNGISKYHRKSFGICKEYK